MLCQSWHHLQYTCQVNNTAFDPAKLSPFIPTQLAFTITTNNGSSYWQFVYLYKLWKDCFYRFWNCNSLHKSNVLPWLIQFCIIVFSCLRVSKYLKLGVERADFFLCTFLSLSSLFHYSIIAARSVWWCHFRLLYDVMALWIRVCKHLQLVRKLVCFKHNNVLCVTHTSWQLVIHWREKNGNSKTCTSKCTLAL